MTGSGSFCKIALTSLEYDLSRFHEQYPVSESNCIQGILCERDDWIFAAVRIAFLFQTYLHLRQYHQTY